MRAITLIAPLLVLVSAAAAQGAWKTYSHPEPAFSVEYPSTWAVTLADKLEDETWGDLSLKGRARVTFRVTLGLDVLQMSVSVYGLDRQIDDDGLLAALKARAKAQGRAEDGVCCFDSPGLLRIGDEFQKAGRTIVRTHVLVGRDVYVVELDVPNARVEECRAGYGHVVDSLLASLQAGMAQPRLPSAEQFASELVAVIDATEKLRNAEMVRLFDEGAGLLKEGLAQGHRGHFKLAQQRFRAMLDIDRNVALGHFALGLAHFYAWEMGWALDEFREAIRLDPKLEPLCPLLWWEDFYELPAGDYVDAYAASWRWHCREDGVLVYRGDEIKGVVVRPSHHWRCTDSRTLARFRVTRGESYLGLFARCGNGYIYTHILDSFALICTEGHDGQPHVLIARTDDGNYVSPGWHTAEFIAVGHSLETYLDGVLLVGGTIAELWDGAGALSLNGKGEILVDWVLVTRYGR